MKLGLCLPSRTENAHTSLQKLIVQSLYIMYKDVEMMCRGADFELRLDTTRSRQHEVSSQARRRQSEHAEEHDISGPWLGTKWPQT